MLACYVNEEPGLWDKFLPFVTLAYNTSKQASLNECPFFLFYGREPNMPNDIITNSKYFSDNEENVYTEKWLKALEIAKTHLLNAQDKQKVYYDIGSKEMQYKENDIVLIRAPNAPGKFHFRWNGPFLITRKLGDLNVEISPLDKNGKIVNPDSKQIVHVNRLKSYSMKPEMKTEIKGEHSWTPRQQKEKTGKRRVGRPRKHPLQQQPTVQGQIPQPTIPKRRGRPPKGVSRNTVNSFKSQEKQRRSPRLEPFQTGQQPCDSNECSTSSTKNNSSPMTIIPIPSPLEKKDYKNRNIVTMIN